MKHTKIFLTVLTSLLTVCFCIFPFSCDVKALTQTGGTTTSYGTYMAETYEQNGDRGNVSISYGGLTVESPIGGGDSVFHLHYDFKDEYSGYIILSITSPSVNSYLLSSCSWILQNGWITNRSSDTYTGTTKQFRLNFYHVTSVDFTIISDNVLVYDEDVTFTMTYSMQVVDTIYDMLDENTSAIGDLYTSFNSICDYKLSDMEESLTEIYTSIESKADYQIDIQSLPAWIFATSSFSTVTYNDTMKYPMVSATAGLTSKYMYFTPGYNYYFYFMAGSTFSNNPVSLKLNNANFELYSLPYYRFNGGFRIWRITITCPGDTEVQDALLYNVDFDMIPLYFGDGSNMTQEMQSVLGVQSENLTTQRLQEIIDILNDMGIDIDLDDDNVTAFNNGTDNVNDFIDTVTDYIPSTDSLTSDINTLPDFANDFVDVSNFVQTVYVEITDVLPQFKYFVIVGLLLFVFGVIIK